MISTCLRKHRVWFLDGIPLQDRYVYAEILFSAYCGCSGTRLSREEGQEIWCPATRKPGVFDPVGSATAWASDLLFGEDNQGPLLEPSVAIGLRLRNLSEGFARAKLGFCCERVLMLVQVD